MQQKWYFEKFGQKMQGSSLPTAKGWVEGIGNLLTPKQKKSLWKKIEKEYYPSKINYRHASFHGRNFWKR